LTGRAANARKEIDFVESFVNSGGTLKGLSSEVMDGCITRIHAHGWIATLMFRFTSLWWHTAILSGAYNLFLRIEFQVEYCMTEVHANVLENQDG